MKKYEETGIDNEILKVMTEKLHYGWDTSFSRDSVKMLIEGIAKYLGEVKDRKVVKAVSLEDLKGNFHFGAFVEFHESEDGKGSFSLTYTFDKDEIKPEFATVTASNPVLHHIIADVGLTKYGVSFRSYEGKEFIIPTMCTVADCIKAYLHANVSIDPAVEMEDFFTATAEIDGDKVYYSLTPSAIIKQHVKEDASIETAA
jgi:hypothetical protein